MNLPDNFHTIFHIESAGTGQPVTVRYSGNVPVLENDSVHIWSVRYCDLSSGFSFLSDLLSKKERDTASRFLNPADSHRYILRHGMVRYILGNYTGTGPEVLPLVTDMNGKPGLDPGSDFHELSFSLSHTDQMVSMGVIKNNRIGIDITRPDPLYPFEDIAGYLFTPMEKKFMRETQPAERYQMFFRIWALKEAVVKATGDGIGMMNTTDVSPVLEVSCNPSSHRLTINEKPMNFLVYRFCPEKEFLGVAAVCLDGKK